MSGTLEVRGAVVRYGDVTALDGADLTLVPGRITGLVGTNGSGKSTLFKAIMGLVPLAGGVVTYDGAPLARARRRGVLGFVPQSEEVDQGFPLAVRDVVAMGRYAGLGPTRRLRAPDHAALAEALDAVDLEDLAHRQIGRLSGGQRKRAFVARVLAQRAQVLLLDEPFAGVDVVSERTISRVLRQRADDGAAVLIASHDLVALPGLADDAVLLQRHVVARGTPAEVLAPEVLARVFVESEERREVPGVGARG
ncbi:ABC transporter related [Beutenbergia cavernae DSM 12333]|uniref:ABC transporter related n=1 Tax=Beutenbergia cavernae (strain ATCC BAA-8 / DSM 12333 / CCUG 43141 / JCM 11478 / NBRC 16432 / NCIMB 13614 / HKI 0122) TaxID=471853 RepID=C5C2G2_BEUC1|nr:metal ABC transporter ATP-binding protein [Beutenbergia cavernae]ACQ79648.1 ABC transporter related [Beutenbergia cavernae DSM 12333]